MNNNRFFAGLCVIFTLLVISCSDVKPIGNTASTDNTGNTENTGNNGNAENNEDTHPEDDFDPESLSVGDFFCIYTNSSGNLRWYIVSKDTDAADIPQDEVAGIVFSTDVDRIGDLEKQTLANAGVSEPHGLVIAVKNAANGVVWGPASTQVNSDSDLVGTNMESYADINGLANTRTVWSYGSYNSSAFPGFYAIQQCNNGDNDYVSRAPSNTTGWYLPSVGQLWDFVENLAQFSLSGYSQGSEELIYIPTASGAISNLDASIEKLENADSFTSRISGQLGYFATSSEVSAENIKVLAIYSAGQIYFRSMAKAAGGSTGYDIRPVLAF